MSRRDTILIVAAPELSAEARGLLSSGGFTLRSAPDAASAYASARGQPPAAILAHVRLPGADGCALVRLLRRDPRTAELPVVLIGERSDSEETRALEAGADAYLARPFSTRLALAKLRAVLRRASRVAPGPFTLHQGGIALDLEGRTAAVRGQAVDLRPKEFDLLAALLERPGRVMTVGQLLESVWRREPGRFIDPHTVQVHVASLRRKLGDRTGQRIVNVFGRGYKFERGRRPTSSRRGRARGA